MSDGKRNKVLRFIGAALGAALMGTAMPSCERIYDDLAPCPHGVSLRFVYDYNMEYANAFPSKVDCLTLLIYDDKGDYVDTRIVTGPELADEAYRMRLDLAEGEYRFAAYGGMACERSSFSLTAVPAAGSKHDDLCAALDADCLTDPARKNLHAMYWGELKLAAGENYRQGTVEMKKNTNNIRLVLQQLSGRPVDAGQFEFEIRDDNTLLGHDNAPVANGETTYTPWTKGQTSTGLLTDGTEVIAAYAELSTSRLVTGNAPRLIVRRKDGDGTKAGDATIVDIPLNNYLLRLRSDLYAEMEDQEFLDRESEWEMVFFLDASLNWAQTHLKINDWEVRINDIEQ